MQGMKNLTAIRKTVFQNRKTKQKSVTIPKDCNIEGGDEVDIFLVKKSKNDVENETDKIANPTCEMARIKTTKNRIIKGDSQ